MKVNRHDMQHVEVIVLVLFGVIVLVLYAVSRLQG